MTLIGGAQLLGLARELVTGARSSARSSCQCCDRDSGRDGHPATCTGWLDVARRAHAYVAQAGPDAGGLRGNRQAPPRGLCAPGRSAVRCRVQPLPGRSVQSRQVVAGLRRGGNGASISTPRAAKLVGAPGPGVIARLSARRARSAARSPRDGTASQAGRSSMGSPSARSSSPGWRTWRRPGARTPGPAAAARPGAPTGVSSKCARAAGNAVRYSAVTGGHGAHPTPRRTGHLVLARRHSTDHHRHERAGRPAPAAAATATQLTLRASEVPRSAFE